MFISKFRVILSVSVLLTMLFSLPVGAGQAATSTVAVETLETVESLPVESVAVVDDENSGKPSAVVSESQIATGVPGLPARITMDELWAREDSLPLVETDASGSYLLNNVHLGAILRLAVQRNRSIVGSAQQVETANAQVIQARSVMGARLTGNFNHTRLDDVLAGKKDNNKAYVEITQPLFLSGKDRSVLKSARLGRSVASSSHTLTRQSVLLETTILWLSWLFATETEQVGQKDLELAEAHHALVSARYRQKQVSQFEVLRAEVRLAQARSDLRKKSNARELACLDLLNNLDLPANTTITTSDRLRMLDVIVDPVKDASEALDLREDLRIKKINVQLARQSIAGARSENQPVVSAFGQSGVQDPSSKSRTGERKGYWQAGVVANFTLSDGGKRYGLLKEANARLAIAENSLQQAIINADIEIRQAYLNIETAREVVIAQEQAVKQAEEALRLAGVRYTNGLFTQVELFDAENAYLATRLQYLQAIFSYHHALASYRLATGQLGRKLLAEASNH